MDSAHIEYYSVAVAKWLFEKLCLCVGAQTLLDLPKGVLSGLGLIDNSDFNGDVVQ